MHTLNEPGRCFHIWPDDGSFEPKHVAEFLILITIYNVVLLTGINYYIIFDKHIDAGAKCYSPAEHLTVDEIIVLIKIMGPF